MAEKIVIHSPKGGQGKTTVAANLSMMLAATGKRVLSVDADESESRGLEYYYNVDADRGLNDLVKGTPLDKVAGEVRDNLYFLAGGDLVQANRVIDEERAMPNAVVEDRLKRHEESFDFIVFDTSPNPKTRLVFNLFYYCDQIVIPIETRRAGVDVLEPFMELVEHGVTRMRSQAKKKKLRVTCMVPYWHTRANASEGSLEILEERYGKLLTNPIGQCTALVEAWSKSAMFSEYLDSLERKPRENELQIAEVFEAVMNKVLKQANASKRRS